MTVIGASARLALAGAVGAALVAVAVPAAQATNVAPKIVAASMVDADKDNKTDRVRLTYSEPISHVLDTSGFPFVVQGYTITRITASSTRTLVIVVAEKPAADITAKPSVTYTRTTAQPVRDAEGLQAVAQTFTGTKQLDLDNDGFVSAPLDCAPNNAAIHPGAVDRPDLQFADTNCDGIDGDAATAIFLDANNGNDVNPGTRALPVQTLPAAFNMRSATRTYVIANSLYAPSSAQVNVPNDFDIYGGYDATWGRSHAPTFMNGKKWVIAGHSDLQLVSIGIGGSDPALQVMGGTTTLTEVELANTNTAGNSVALFVSGTGTVRMVRGSLTTSGAAPSLGSNSGIDGTDGDAGGNGDPGSCDTFNGGDGGYGGGWVQEEDNPGGNGGLGGRDAGDSEGNGLQGTSGSGGAVGGTPGAAGNPGKAGGLGGSGANGADGTNGHLVLGAFTVGGYVPAVSTDGTPGQDGAGGAGGGGGGGQVGATVISGVGNGGGGGGQGARGGTPGKGRRGGYASIAAYVPFGTITLEGTVVTTGPGGNSGAGGLGGDGGTGGAGGTGGSACLSEVGRGGNGGKGGDGGDGGDGGPGQGGHSIGVFGGVFAQVDVSTAVFNLGPAGAGPSAIRANVHRP
jgi:hypothetical protein